MRSRIKRLEATFSTEECLVCGQDPANPVTDYAVVWEDVYTEDSGNQADEPEYCHGCGRQLTYIVVWEDLPRGPPEQKEHEHDD